MAGEPVRRPCIRMDGTGVPIWKADFAGRVGKQPDGTARTRQVKLCTVWSAEGRDPDGTPIHDAGSISYSAAIESAAPTGTEAPPSALSMGQPALWRNSGRARHDETDSGDLDAVLTALRAARDARG